MPPIEASAATLMQSCCGSLKDALAKEIGETGGLVMVSSDQNKEAPSTSD
jgi:hypothetical protein